MGFLGIDLSTIFSIQNLVAIFGGTFVGLLFGALPGLGVSIALVLLLPLTYNMAPVSGILLLLAAFQAAEYGGSISAITLGIPGTVAAAATCFDGNVLAKKSSPGKALAYSLVASTIGGLVGGLVLATLTKPIGRFALRLSDPEYFLIGIVGLLAVSGLSSKDRTKSLISAVLGLMASTVGVDVITGQMRFVFGRRELLDGFRLMGVMVGVFGISEMLSIVSEHLHTKYITDTRGLKTHLSWKELKSVAKPISLGSLIGVILGIIPGLGSSASTFLSYTTAKKISKHPEEFGQGSPEGIAAPEAANNATVGGALVPLLSLGIPGSSSAAIVVGAFIIHGIFPGPSLFKSDITLVNGILFGFILTTIVMFIVGKLTTPLFARILVIPNTVLAPLIWILAFTGVFADRGQFFDLWMALAFGIFSFIMKKLNYSMPTFVLSFILGSIIEQSLRRSLIMSFGSYSIFVTRPYALILLLVIVAMLIGPYVVQFVKKRKEKKAETA